jgi:TPR repeat protein
MSAEQGYAPAEYNLGGMYSRGLSKTLTRDEALEWLAKAAAQGHSAAERELAALEAEGDRPPVGIAEPHSAERDQEQGALL